MNVSCEKNNSSEKSIPQRELILLAQVDLPCTEPSGVAFSETMQKIWIVSGGDQQIYVFDIAGNFERKLKYIGIDLEGIVFDELDSSLWVIDESSKEVAHLDLDGNVLFHTQELYSSAPNKGPEGITIGGDRKIYIVNERDPTLLFELDSTYTIAQSYNLDFAADLSDLSYESTDGSFLILSDESNALFRWDKFRGVLFKYLLPNTKNEGVGFDKTRNVFYIVNDATAKLYFYK